MGLRRDYKMPKTKDHDLLLEGKLRKRLGSRKEKIMFLLSEEGNDYLHQKLANHVNENLVENSIYLQMMRGDNGQEYIVVNLLSPFPKAEDTLEPIIISTNENLGNCEVVSARTYWELSNLCLDPEVERGDLEIQLEDAI